MASTIPKVTGKLRERTLEFANDSSQMIDRIYAVLVASEESYARLTPAVQQDVLGSIKLSAKLWFDSILTGAPPPPDEMEVFSSSGRRRVHQGVPLSSLLRAFRLGSLELWRDYLDVASADTDLRDEMLFVVSPYLLDHFDVVAQAVAQDYLDEQYQRTRWRDALRYELCSIVFGFPDDASGFRKTAEALGLDSTAPRVAIAIDLELQGVMPSNLEGELDRLALAIASHLKTTNDELVRFMHRGRLVVWTPCARGESILDCDLRMTKSVASLVMAVPALKAVGVGLMNQGASGWSASVEEAFKALDSGLRIDKTMRTRHYSDIAVDESVRRTDNVLRYLDSMVQRLLHEPELLLTLQVYFEQMQKRKVTAGVLGIHPNTLNYRLERIETLLGAKLDEPAWIAKLHTALKLRQISVFDGERNADAAGTT